MFLIVLLQVTAQTVKLTYKESDEDFANPERGFYIPLGTKASNFVFLNTQQLTACRTKLQQAPGASYQINMSL